MHSKLFWSKCKNMNNFKVKKCDKYRKKKKDYPKWKGLYNKGNYQYKQMWNLDVKKKFHWLSTNKIRNMNLWGFA